MVKLYRRKGNEKLTPVRIRAAVRHTQDSRACMLQPGMDFVLELLAINRGASAACAGWVARLKHEIRNYAVKYDVVEVTALCEVGEVFAGLWQ